MNRKFVSIAPLIGGMSIGAGRALGGQLPTTLYGYAAHASNDALFHAYLDSLGHKYNKVELDYQNGASHIESDVFLSTAVPNCSGLSSANVKASATHKANDCLIHSTIWALSELRPKIHILENAPALFGNRGHTIRQMFADHARENGYVTQFIKVSTLQFGIPQKRERTFGLFYKGLEKTPVFHNVPKEDYVPWREYLGQRFEQYGDDSLETVLEQPNWLLTNPLLKFLIDKGVDISEHKGSALGALLALGYGDEFVKTYSESDPKSWEFKEARTVARAMVKNVMDFSPRLIGDKTYLPTVMYRFNHCVHPERRTRFTPREQMRLMGLPEDMQIPWHNENAIAQNVCVDAAEAVTRMALRAYEYGEVADWSTGIVMQNLRTQQWWTV